MTKITLHNYQTRIVGEVCEVIAGQSPEGRFYNDSGKGLPFYQGKKEFTDKYIGKPTTWTTVITKEARAGDILMSVRAPVGPINFATQKICIGRGLAAIRAGKKVDKEYLYSYLEKCENEIVGNSGAVFNSISKTQIEKISIPLPSLLEQKRIVAVLDVAFVALTKAKENAKNNLQNAHELFDSYLQSVFANPGDGWEEKKLGEVCEYFNGKAHEQCIETEGKYIVINSKFIASDGRVFKRTNDALFPLSQGDLAMVLSDVPNGKALAKCYLIEKNDTYSLNQRICAVRSDKFYNKFLYYQLNRNKHFLSFDNGGNQTNLRLNQILDCPLYLPPISEQKSIASRLDAFSEETKKLESIYQQKLADLEELKKSILQKAFNGELVGAY